MKIKIPSRPSKPTSVRKKTAADLAREVADAERKARLEMNHTNAKERTACEQVKQRSAFELEELRLRYQREEGEHHRAHERMMIEQQIELEKIWAASQVPLDPQLKNVRF